MRCIFNRLSRAQRPCCWKLRLLKMRLFFFKLHSLVHKLKAIDFALHTSHIENLVWNVLECQKTMLETKPRVCSNIWGEWTRIEQSTLKPSALCDSLRPLSHFPLCPKYSLPRPLSDSHRIFLFVWACHYDRCSVRGIREALNATQK